MSRLRFCPRCGGRLAWRTRGHDPHPRCDRCGYVLWQNPKPTVGAVIVRRRIERSRMVLRPVLEVPAALREKLPELKGMLAAPYLSTEPRAPRATPREIAGHLRRRRPGTEVLLVRRKGEPRRGAWDVPGGFVEPFEPPEDALHRQVRDELGIEVELLALIGIFADTYGDQESTLTIHYAAAIADGLPSADAAEWFPVNALPGDLAFQNVADALTALQEMLEEGELAL